MEFIKNHNKTAIIYEDREYSYISLINNAKNYGNFLNINKEDKVVVFLENRPELLFTFLGVWDKKGTCVCIDASSSLEEFLYFVEDCKPKYIFVSDTTYEIVNEAVKTSNLDITIINVDTISESEENKDGIIYAPEKDSVALILYTSGTTGKPKGVMLTFDNILVNIEELKKYNMFLKTDRLLALLPMHHILPLLGSGIVPLERGATIIFLKEMSSQAMIEAFKKYKVTIMIGVPKLWELLHKKILEKIESSKISSFIFKLTEKINNKSFSKKIFKKVHEGFGGHLRFFVSGGSKLNPEISKTFLTLGIDICEGYGLTETAPMISFTPINEVVPGSAGKVLSGIDVKISDDGEILAKGRNLMKGYLNKPKETAEVINEDGWFHTGDLGEIKDNYLYITGRKKEMIVLSNGKNINPIEIEQIFQNSSELISEVVVTELNGILTALIYPDDKKVTENKVENIYNTLKKTVVETYNSKVAPYKKILDLKIVNAEFPKTRIGKIKRFMLASLFENSESKKNEDENQVKEKFEKNIESFKEYEIISQFLSKLKNKKIYSSDSLEFDLSLDSLDVVELVSFVENSFEITLTKEILEQNETVIKLSEYIKENNNNNNNNNVHVSDMSWSEILKIENRSNFPKSNFMGRLMKEIMKIFFKFFIKLEIKDIKNAKTDEPTIFIANHQCFLDASFFMDKIDNQTLDNTFYLAKIDHFKNKFLTYFAKNSNVLVMDVNNNLKDILQSVGTAIRDGKNILIFPEGMRTRSGEMSSFKKFYAILAKELNIPIIPFAIKGGYELFPPGKKLPKLGKVEVTFLPKRYAENLEIDEIIERDYEDIYSIVYGKEKK